MFGKNIQDITSFFCTFDDTATTEIYTLSLLDALPIYEFLIEHHFDRKDMLAALGGGVVGDLKIGRAHV